MPGMPIHPARPYMTGRRITHGNRSPLLTCLGSSNCRLSALKPFKSETNHQRARTKSGKGDFSTVNMATATPQRRSLARPRPSLGISTSETQQTTPNLTNRYTFTQRPPLAFQLSASAASGASTVKSPLGQPNLGRSPSSYDGSPRSALRPAQRLGSSPLTTQSKKPAMAPIVTNHKVISGDDLEVGDAVDVPGGMHGTIKFLGEVKGKKGIFAGVELSREWAARGKNDGDVEGLDKVPCIPQGAANGVDVVSATSQHRYQDRAFSFPRTKLSSVLLPPTPPARFRQVLPPQPSQPSVLRSRPPVRLIHLLHRCRPGSASPLVPAGRLVLPSSLSPVPRSQDQSLLFENPKMSHRPRLGGLRSARPD